jgi:hypothetical protein
VGALHIRLPNALDRDLRWHAPGRQTFRLTPPMGWSTVGVCCIIPVPTSALRVRWGGDVRHVRCGGSAPTSRGEWVVCDVGLIVWVSCRRAHWCVSARVIPARH